MPQKCRPSFVFTVERIARPRASVENESHPP